MRALVVYAHPVEGSLCSAVRDRVLAGLAAGSHDHDLVDLYAEGFDPTGAPGGDDLAPQVARLRRAQALVFVYPTWWGAQPAMLAGWLERAVGRAGRLPDVRRVVAVTTHGSPKRINAVEGEPGKRVMTRHLRARCHPRARCTWLAFYGVDSAREGAIASWLDGVERRMARPGL